MFWAYVWGAVLDAESYGDDALRSRFSYSMTKDENDRNSPLRVSSVACLPCVRVVTSPIKFYCICFSLFVVRQMCRKYYVHKKGKDVVHLRLTH